MINLTYIFVVLIGFNMTTKENTNVPGATAIPTLGVETDKPFAEGTSYFTNMKTKYVTFPGQKFSRLVVIENFTKIDKRGFKWHFVRLKCDCGKIVEASVYDLYKKKSTTKSCGCLARDRITKHGMFGTRLYNTWIDMRNRIERTDDHNYHNYGGRGITICVEWREFIPFMNWALSSGYQDNLTIDRIDTNGNYEPSNCRFVPLIENIWNKRQKPDWGILKRKNHYRAKIMRRGVTYYSPPCKSKADAILFRDNIVLKYNLSSKNAVIS